MTPLVRSLRSLNYAALVAVLVVNILAGQSQIGAGIGAVSDAHPTLVTPPGWTFSIWVLIYSLFVLFGFYVWKDTPSNTALIDSLGYMLFVNCCLNIGWIFAWCYEYVEYSVVIILFTMASAGLLYRRVYCWYISDRPEVYDIDSSDSFRYVAVWLPFSVYFAWLIVASVLCMCAVLLDQDSEYITANSVAGLVVIGTLLIIVACVYKDPVIVAVGVWAFSGIASRATNLAVIYTSLCFATLSVFLSLGLHHAWNSAT